jgi:hypothetical protein
VWLVGGSDNEDGGRMCFPRSLLGFEDINEAARLLPRKDRVPGVGADGVNRIGPFRVLIGFPVGGVFDGFVFFAHGSLILIVFSLRVNIFFIV